VTLLQLVRVIRHLYHDEYSVPGTGCGSVFTHRQTSVQPVLAMAVTDSGLKLAWFGPYQALAAVTSVQACLFSDVSPASGSKLGTRLTPFSLRVEQVLSSLLLFSRRQQEVKQVGRPAV
jgi:hypothetical protein